LDTLKDNQGLFVLISHNLVVGAAVLVGDNSTLGPSVFFNSRDAADDDLGHLACAKLGRILGILFAQFSFSLKCFAEFK